MHESRGQAWTKEEDGHAAANTSETWSRRKEALPPKTFPPPTWWSTGPVPGLGLGAPPSSGVFFSAGLRQWFLAVDKNMQPRAPDYGAGVEDDPFCPPAYPTPPTRL